jgi:hypothetical protein
MQITRALAISRREIKSNGFKRVELLLLILLVLLLCSKRQTNNSDMSRTLQTCQNT